MDAKGTTEGMPNNMRALYAEVTQQRQAVSGLLDETDGTGGMAAAPVTTTVIDDELVSMLQARLGQ